MSATGEKWTRGSEWLFGRDDDLEAIGTCLAAGRDIALVAPAGMGKTSVAHEALRRLAHSGWLTAWVPAAQAAGVMDIAEILAGQLAHASRRFAAAELESIVEEVTEGREDPERYLGLALEGLASAAQRLGVRVVLVVDDLDALFAAGRTAELGALFARKLRSARQRSVDLSVLYLMRSDVTLHNAFGDPTAPLFGETTTHRLGPLPTSACERLVENRIRSAGRQLTEEALSRFASDCRGMPLYLGLAADAAARVEEGEATIVDLRVAEGALEEAVAGCEPATAERIESIRRSHRLALEVARRLAAGDSPYAGEKAPNNITRALKNLEKLGVAHQPGAREWTLTDPFLERALRKLDPTAVAAQASTALATLPVNPPSPDATLRRLRDNTVWGLGRHWFEPSTVIRDAVHGEIKLTRLERAIVQTAEFQRLRRIKQLGAVQLVYPGATHTRLEHSIGVLAVSSSLLEALIQSNGRDTFTARLPEPGLDWSEALVLGRIGGLVHHLATIPYADALEGELGSHLAAPRTRLARTWLAVVEQLERAGLSEKESGSLAHGRFHSNLWQALDGRSGHGDPELAFVQDLLLGPLSADSFDNVARDRQALGLPPSSAARIASGMRVAWADRRQRWRVAVGGPDRSDVGSELLRHFQLLVQHRQIAAGHRTTRAANAMLAAAASGWAAVLCEQRQGDWLGSVSPAEDSLLSYGDDGLVDHLLDFSARKQQGAITERSRAAMEAMRHLVGGLARRRLYDLVATAGAKAAVADRLFAEFGEPERRRQLERQAAQAAGIAGPGRILIVVPRLPRPVFGDTLISDGGGIARICERQHKVAQSVMRLDEQLLDQWSVDVFADPDLSARQRRTAADWVATRLRLRWEWSEGEGRQPE